MLTAFMSVHHVRACRGPKKVSGGFLESDMNSLQEQEVLSTGNPSP